MIKPFEDRLLQPASYDLCIGKECELEGRLRILTKNKPAISVAPGAFAVLTTLESLQLPKDVIGRAGLSSRYALLGLQSTMGPQIDPGFQGLLTIPVVNMGNAEMTMRLGDPFLTVEFSKLDRRAPRGYAELYGASTRMRRESPLGVKARPDFGLLAKLDNTAMDLKAKVSEMERTTTTIVYAMLIASVGGIIAGIVIELLRKLVP
jgi:deoxycytidine triphosphate deaminase